MCVLVVRESYYMKDCIFEINEKSYNVASNVISLPYKQEHTHERVKRVSVLV